jgi:general secretion pathway protein F
MEGENKRAVVSKLRDMGYFPLKVEEVQGKAKAKAAAPGEKSDAAPKLDLKKKFQRVRLQERNIFFRQLANLIDSGMIITRALRTLTDQTENSKLAEVIDSLRVEVQQGATFADALESHPRLFPPLYVSLVRAGEAGGMLEEVLWRIVTFGEQEEELRGKAVSAMVYPAFLSIVGSAAIFILISFVFPKFIAIFEEFNAELPAMTLAVMAVCDFMGKYWWAVLGIFGIFVYGFRRFAQTEKGRIKIDGFLLRVPAVRTVIQKYEMAKFARTLGTLLDNGVPVLTALRITSETVTNRMIRAEVSEIHKGVTEGESISESLTECSHFPPMVVSMFAVGEESGRIGAVAKRVADAYDVEVDRAVKALTALFEPLLVVIMGVIVGFLVIAMLLPMMTMSAAI